MYQRVGYVQGDVLDVHLLSVGCTGIPVGYTVGLYGYHRVMYRGMYRVMYRQPLGLSQWFW